MQGLLRGKKEDLEDSGIGIRNFARLGYDTVACPSLESLWAQSPVGCRQ